MFFSTFRGRKKNFYTVVVTCLTLGRNHSRFTWCAHPSPVILIKIFVSLDFFTCGNIDPVVVDQWRWPANIQRVGWIFPLDSSDVY